MKASFLFNFLVGVLFVYVHIQSSIDYHRFNGILSTGFFHSFVYCLVNGHWNLSRYDRRIFFPIVTRSQLELFLIGFRGARSVLMHYIRLFHNRKQLVNIFFVVCLDFCVFFKWMTIAFWTILFKWTFTQTFWYRISI